MINYNSVEYYENFDQSIKISEDEVVLFKRLSDNVVMISVMDIITGTTTKLGFYKFGRWSGYNPVNYERLFNIFRENEGLTPKLIRFLTPNNSSIEYAKIERVFSCAKRKFHITIRKSKKTLRLD